MKNNRTFLEKLLDGAEVEWKPLDEVANIVNNARKPVKSSLRVSGNIPYYGANNIQDYVEGYTHEGEFVLIAEDGSASLENYSIQWAVGKFWANNHVHVVNGKEKLNNRFLYHYLTNMNFIPFLAGKERAKLTKAKLQQIPIPIPPLSVQTEIVKILDALTALTSELTSELILRQKQYEYYREKLLSFDSLEQLNSGGGEKKLIDVAKIKNGKDWKHLEEGNIPIYGSGGIIGYVDTYSYDKPTVLIPRKGTITNIFYLEEPFWNVDTIYYTEIDTTQILPKYFYHFMKTVDLTKLDTGSGRPSLTQAILNEIPIFVPSIEEQQRIVSILDKFETLTNSITEGLPLAIEQSQKRYEYYRELLLSFNGSN
ncbi:restriction endonuclease subunit S [Haemophilus influenzae]|uniref:restriction endonuclease subunit S n=1 Tax=Haemophilus influenzae TaxID=727 RepID=UPI000D001248|nr:restriction endonuclease subunit S [Haemophilus influenzae]PRI90126.1 putative type-1 restriction enzyme specificity protein [Haemophilus influenzae]